MAQVLVIDDDPRVLRYATLLLQFEGHRVRTESTYDEGLAAIAEAGFDVSWWTCRPGPTSGSSSCSPPPAGPGTCAVCGSCCTRASRLGRDLLAPSCAIRCPTAWPIVVAKPARAAVPRPCPR